MPGYLVRCSQLFICKSIQEAPWELFKEFFLVGFLKSKVFVDLNPSRNTWSILIELINNFLDFFFWCHTGPENTQGNKWVSPAGENCETAIGNLEERRKIGVYVCWENECPLSLSPGAACQLHFWITRLSQLPFILPSETAYFALADMGLHTAVHEWCSMFDGLHVSLQGVKSTQGCDLYDCYPRRRPQYSFLSPSPQSYTFLTAGWVCLLIRIPVVICQH